jgi:ABC-type glycerol-3-phosphate transport system substrate-binding protein
MSDKKGGEKRMQIKDAPEPIRFQGGTEYRDSAWYVWIKLSGLHSKKVYSDWTKGPFDTQEEARDAIKEAESMAKSGTLWMDMKEDHEAN